MKHAEADVCLILEGTYPYVSGGVSTWTHELLKAQSDIRFHLLTLVPGDLPDEPLYEVPKNVVGSTRLVLQDLPLGRIPNRTLQQILDRLAPHLEIFLADGGLAELEAIRRILEPHRHALGRQSLLNSKPAWELLVRMYNNRIPEGSFLDYFWTWRTVLSSFYSLMLADLPQAKLYHPVSTGYAGLMAARAHLETGAAVILTEHGIYTTERRIEIAMANWLYEVPHEGLAIEDTRASLKGIWVDLFAGYSRTCYEASEQIITLYEGNQVFQREEGADPDRMCVIPNGIDFEHFAAMQQERGAHPPTVALIGRVVPIKDVKTFLRAVAILQRELTNVRAWILGPTDEDLEYFEECREMVELLGLQDCVEFKGKVRLDDHLAEVDVIALTSISEAQPLVILEAGAAGIPSVVTDVGACREMILGRGGETPALGPAGEVTTLSNPQGTAEAMARLLNDSETHRSCSRAIRQRVETYYNKSDLDRSYHDLYVALLSHSTVQLESVI